MAIDKFGRLFSYFEMIQWYLGSLDHFDTTKMKLIYKHLVNVANSTALMLRKIRPYFELNV